VNKKQKCGKERKRKKNKLRGRRRRGTKEERHDIEGK
jgi:hypothetical protein